MFSVSDMFAEEVSDLQTVHVPLLRVGALQVKGRVLVSNCSDTALQYGQDHHQY